MSLQPNNQAFESELTALFEKYFHLVDLYGDQAGEMAMITAYVVVTEWSDSNGNKFLGATFPAAQPVWDTNKLLSHTLYYGSHNKTPQD